MAAFSLIAVLIFGGLCLAPVHCFYMRARKELLIVLWNILISPFGIVRFKHFFLADIITSFVNPLKDIGFMSCFYISGGFLKSDLPTNAKCEGLLSYTLIIAFLPYWFRFAQCLRRYHDTNLKAHLVNAGKYFSSLCIQLASLLKTLYPSKMTVNVLIIVSIVSTVYCLGWDYYMDWGLFRSNEKGKKYLRSKILYPFWFYYYAMISNFIMRFFWILGILTFPTWVSQSQLIILI